MVFSVDFIFVCCVSKLFYTVAVFDIHPLIFVFSEMIFLLLFPKLLQNFIFLIFLT